MRLRVWVTVCSVALALGCAREFKRPNIILVVIDTLRADHLSHYGYDRPTAVNLDAFREHATLFTHCYSPAPWTAPSVASLLTGLFTARHRANAHGARLGDDALTLPELLQGRGWTTIAHTFNPEITRKTGFAQGFDHFDEFSGNATVYPDISEMMTRVRRRFLTGVKQPFFLYLQPMNVHGPYKVAKGYEDVLLGRKPAGLFHYNRGNAKRIMKDGGTKLRRKVKKPYLDSMMEQYDTAIRYTTDQLAQFLTWLKVKGLYNDALIIITSDHGEELFDHQGFGHGYSLFNEVLHVPLYIKLPGQLEGRRSSNPVFLRDLYPTLLELLGIEVDQLLDGRSLVPELKGKAPDGAARVRLHQTEWKGRCVARSIVKEPYELIDITSNYEGLQNESRLYHLERDPTQRKDLAAKEKQLVKTLRTELEAHFAHFAKLALREPENILDEMDTERLRALGYLD